MHLRHPMLKHCPLPSFVIVLFQMEHERVLNWQRFTQAQLTVLTQQWQRDQEELLARALVTLQEARHAHQEELELHRDRQNQQDICSHLREKVRVWYTLYVHQELSHVREHFILYETVLFMLEIIVQFFVCNPH